MANSSETKLNRIYKLLSEYNFQWNVKDKLKCIKCQRILINACQSRCGCDFCRKCVDEMVVNGIDRCPGNTADCKNENLSNFMPDYRMNLKISKLLVKCPKQMCEHECQLIDMEEHMRLCSQKTVPCPCHNLGCHDDNLAVDKINEHLQTDSYNHWTMLMDLIGEFRNEVTQLRKTENANNNKIETLKEERLAKDDRIEAMTNEMTNEIRKCQIEMKMLSVERQVMSDDMKLLKDEMKILRRQIDIGKETVDSKIDDLSDEMNGQIKSIKMESAEFSGELSNLNRKFEGIGEEVNGRLNETRQVIIDVILYLLLILYGCMGHVKDQLDLINEVMRKYKEEMTVNIKSMMTKIDGMERKLEGTRFVWPIDKISKLIHVPSVSYMMFPGILAPLGKPSEYFFPKTNKYKMQLQMDNNKSLFQIKLSIHPGLNDASLQWPFQAKVTVKVTNKAVSKACLKVTNYCKIDRPLNESSKCSDPFQFPLADLFSKGLLQDDCCIVECLIDIE